MNKALNVNNRPLLCPPLEHYLAHPLAAVVDLHASRYVAADEVEAIARCRRILAAHYVGEVTALEVRREVAALEQLLAEVWLFRQLEGLGSVQARRQEGGLDKEEKFEPETDEPGPGPDDNGDYPRLPRED